MITGLFIFNRFSYLWDICLVNLVQVPVIWVHRIGIIRWSVILISFRIVNIYGKWFRFMSFNWWFWVSVRIERIIILFSAFSVLLGLSILVRDSVSLWLLNLVCILNSILQYWGFFWSRFFLLSFFNHRNWFLLIILLFNIFLNNSIGDFIQGASIHFDILISTGLNILLDLGIWSALNCGFFIKWILWTLIRWRRIWIIQPLLEVAWSILYKLNI